MNSNLKITGDLDVTLLDEFGNIKLQEKYKNMVMTVGKNFIASRIRDTTSAVMSHMGVGTGTTAESAGQTALVTQLVRVALTSTTASNNQVIYAATFAAGEGTGAITEAGIFNAGSGGTMLSRTVFSAVNKAASDTLIINWTITVN